MGTDEKQISQIAMLPNYVFEKQSERYMSIINRLVIVIIVLIVCFVGYVFYNSSYETYSIQQEAEADNNGTVRLNSVGEMTIYGGESEAENYYPEKEE